MQIPGRASRTESWSNSPRPARGPDEPTRRARAPGICNYIDAFALIGRGALVALDGYSYDHRLYGWEDYDLWVRIAESGRYGMFVPAMIAPLPRRPQFDDLPDQ